MRHLAQNRGSLCGCLTATSHGCDFTFEQHLALAHRIPAKRKVPFLDSLASCIQNCSVFPVHFVLLSSGQLNCHSVCYSPSSNMLCKQTHHLRHLPHPNGRSLCLAVEFGAHVRCTHNSAAIWHLLASWSSPWSTRWVLSVCASHFENDH